MFLSELDKLVSKYNLPVPRYTSYPTVPFWKEEIDRMKWQEAFRDQYINSCKEEGISIYIHLPFCESLCTYCGCNKKITTNHQVEEEYIDAITKEWDLYRKLMPQKPVIREIHLGGGTPTFFSPENLSIVLNRIFDDAIVHPQKEFSLEGHPNNTTRNHLETLFKLGFSRISYGVQDNDPEVQRIINRIQPLENVKNAIQHARYVGYRSVNFDLIYGLPRQTLASMERTISQTLDLKPDRIAFYSYAHVPWNSRAQRLFDENDLPDAELKMQLYLLAKRMFLSHGYVDIGMDHFSLPSDELFLAKKAGQLYRNFMGYSARRTGFLLGLGVSAISDIGKAFAQNQKTLQHYYDAINRKEFAVTKGHFLSREDISFRKYILDISCNGHTIFRNEDRIALEQFSFPELKKLATDRLVVFNNKELTVTDTGTHFIRNICRAFDLHLLRNDPSIKPAQFSRAV
ncbi:MAG TPA: oxygen-independent coproporphyrinogen III oxidase [Puia sp.]|nr:oxygen-independent coproporphyrinogen III oxidase [Puia sp.]